MLYHTFLVIHVLITIVLILVVLLQTGKGADIGAVFGGGGAVFGGVGATTFLHKLTIGLAAAFMTTSLLLAIIAPTSKETIFKPIPEATIPVSSPLAPPADAEPAGEVETIPTETAEPAASTDESSVPAPATSEPATPEH